MKITEIKTYPVFVGTRNQCIVLYRSSYFEGGRVLTAAMSAIDIALHDLVGKALGVPVYQLLGGKHRDFVPGFATTQSPILEGIIEDVKLLLAHGWRVIRANPGFVMRDAAPDVYEPWESIPLTASWLTKIREAVGTDFVLGTDYHHRLTVAEAASFCQKMPPGTLDFLEEPIRDEAPEAYEALRKMIDIPLAIGEEFSNKWAFVPYLERGITNYARIDVCNVGGLTEAMKVAGLAEAHYIDLMPHNPLGPICTAATVPLAAAVPNLSWVEVRTTPTEHLGFDDATIFPVQLGLEGARYPVPTAPGLGVEVNEEYVANQEFQFGAPWVLHRRDGSITNW